MNDLHELLPWYANGTLTPEENGRFEEHLIGCEACRKELGVLEKMQERLEAEGKTLLAGHPSPEELVAATAGDGGDSRAAEVRRHMALCLTCADEARRARVEGAAVLTAAERASSFPAPRQKAGPFPWGWAAAAALFLVVITAGITSRLDEPGGATGIGALGLVEPTERGQVAGSIVAVPPGATMVHVLFPIDVDPAGFPLRIVVSDVTDTLIHEDDSVSERDLYRGTFLFLQIRREECPDGEYRMRVTPATAPEIAIEYPFRVQTTVP